MKKARAILSLILCFSIVVSLCHITYADEPADVVTNDTVSVNNDATTDYRGLFEVMGILSPELEDDDEISRGDFLLLLIKLMNFELSEDSRSSFDDVQNKTLLASALNYAVDLKIVSQSDSFRPDDDITYYQALKMCVCALGHDEWAQYNGGWPTGYVKAAQMLNIDLTNSYGDFQVSDAINLLGYMCEAKISDVVSVEKNEMYEYSYKYEAKDIFLYHYNNIYIDRGTVTSNDVSCLDDGDEKMNSGEGLIGDNTYLTQKDVKCPLGYNVTVFVRDYDNKKDVIIHSSLHENKVIKIEANSAPDLDGGKLIYFEGNKEKCIKCSDMKSVIYNGKSFDKYKDADFSIKDGYIEAIDNNCDNVFDVFALWIPRYVVVDYADPLNGYIYDTNNENNINLRFDDSDSKYTTDIPLFDMSHGHVLKVYVSKDEKLINIKREKNKVTGVVEGVSSSGETVISGEEYRASEYFTRNYSKLYKIGDEVTVFYGEGNTLIAITSVDTDTDYAYLEDAKIKPGIDETVIVKLFNEDGEVVVYTLSEKVFVNDKPEDKASACDLLLSHKGELIRYVSDEDKIISRIYTQSETLGMYVGAEDGKNTLKRYDYPGYNTTKEMPYKITGYFVPYFTINDATKIFCVSLTETDDNKKFNLGNGKAFLTNDTKVAKNNLWAYNVNEAGCAEAILYIADSYTTTVDKTGSSGIVSKITRAIVDEDSQGLKVEICSKGNFKMYSVKPDAPCMVNGELPVRVGDMIRFNVSSDGAYITNVKKDFDYATRSIVGLTEDNTSLHYYYGDLYYAGTDSVGIRQSDGTIIYLPLKLGNQCYIDETGVSVIPVTGISTYKQLSSACSKILVKCIYSAPQESYIYK